MYGAGPTGALHHAARPGPAQRRQCDQRRAARLPAQRDPAARPHLFRRQGRPAAHQGGNTPGACQGVYGCINVRLIGRKHVDRLGGR